MACMKCGRETQESQVFCDECLLVMDRYPVKPDTVIQLPKRAPRVEKKVSRKTPLAEVVQKQKATIRWMALALTLLFAALCLVSGMLYFRIYMDAGVLNPEALGATQSETTANTTE